MKKISTYWKCQLIGWGIFTLVDVILVIVYLSYENDSPLLMYGRVAIVSLLGLTVSHLMHNSIAKLNILKQSFGRQVVYVLLITVCFNILYTGSWIVIYYTFNLKDMAEQRQTNYEIFYWVTYGFFDTLLIWNLLYFIYHYVKKLLNNEKQKIATEKQIWEMEVHALRAQMNPRFIFNCMNVLKNFIENNDDGAVDYLTIFSKLIRIILQNADKREITLYDELEICRLYAQLERMSLNKKFTYQFMVDEQIDLKSVQVPALILQSFVEKAIWHGIMPKSDDGSVNIVVKKLEDNFCCIIDDDGIGREMSKQKKLNNELSAHQEGGIHLTQNKTEAANMLNERNYSVEIIDKNDVLKKMSGTRVILSFKEY